MSGRAFGRETKFQKVRTELEFLANRLGPEQKLPSIRELAVTMNASVSTLTGALDDLESQNLVYRKHGVGIFVSPARIKSIWLICDSQFFSHGHSPFWDVMVDAARVRALEHNEHLSMHFTLPQGRPDATLHHSLVEEIEAGRVHGIIGVGLGRSAAEWLASQNIPYTAFAGWAPYTVAIHHLQLARRGVKALAERGCKRIALWETTDPLNQERDSFPVPDTCKLTDAFVEALQENGLPVHQELIRNNWHLLTATTPEPYQHQGYRTAKEVFERDGLRPDGIVIADDTMTHGALLAMARMGIQPGRDVMLVSHANKGTSILLDDEDIIRVQFDPSEVVNRLFGVLEILMAGETPDNTLAYYPDAQTLLVEPEVVFPNRHFRN